MPSARPPWWLYLFAAAYTAYLAMMVWCALRGPADSGIIASFTQAAIRVESVLPGSAAARAGIREGDRIVAANGQPVRSRMDWRAFSANWQSGRTERLTIERSGESILAALPVEARRWSEWTTGGAIVSLFLWLLRFGTLVLAVMLVLRRRGEPAALAGAWFLASSSVAAFVLLNGMGAVWRSMPSLIGAVFWAPAASALLLGPAFFTFCAVFPRPVFRTRWMLAAAWIPALLEARWFLGYLRAVVYTPGRTSGVLEPWMVPLYAATFIAYLAGGLALLAVSYRRSSEVSERRRLRLLAAGAVAGWLAVLPLVVLEWLGAGSSLAPGFFEAPVAAVTGVLFVAALALVVYALLRRRVFGIGIIIRQGLRYALARRFVVMLAPAVLVALVADLLMHGDQALLVILKTRGWIYAVAGAAAIVIQRQRDRWLEALDRRFFRERYDAQRLLREVIEEVRTRDIRSAAVRSVALMEAALHPEFVALLIREEGEKDYRSLAAAPVGQAPAMLPGGGKLTGLVRVLGSPLDVARSTGGWLDQRLPVDEVEFVRNARIELLVPIPSDSADALLALGFKRSEEPYSREDRDVLSAIAASLALMLDQAGRAPVPQAAATSFNECPQCGTCYDTRAQVCPREGAALTPRPLPRVLAERYRLDRRLGSGGMGAVYAGTDVALGRQVAVKLIRDELVGSPEAAERFRYEARAAAAFAHPNIVTVHDFGVVASRHAYLIMEYLQGATLREELRRSGPLGPRRTMEILRGVCSGVEAAHRRRLLHRDLKPENILLARAESGDVPKILDFGVAKPLQNFTVTGADTELLLRTDSAVLVGTLQYMSPEHLMMQEPSPGWDVWALSVIVYEMLTGAYPFPADAWRMNVLEGRFVPVHRNVAEAPPGWQQFFQRAFSRTPQERPQSARQFCEELERVLL
jgi:serine/threonine-protein kinase